MKKIKNDVQHQIDEYRKTGKSFLSLDDMDMDFSKCDEKPKKSKTKINTTKS